jgi:predicted lipoprotein with Yx(FWY)xxD motif
MFRALARNHNQLIRHEGIDHMDSFTDPAVPARSGRRRRVILLGLIPAAGVLAAACGSSGTPAAAPTTTSAPTGSTSTTSASTPPTTSGPRPVVKTMTVGNLGKIIVNPQDQVLYSLTKNGTPQPCTQACQAVWPPVTLPAGVTTPTGSAGVPTLATTTANGVTQVTASGLPLFTYSGDSAPGIATGNNLVSFGGIWKVIKAQ